MAATILVTTLAGDILVYNNTKRSQTQVVPQNVLLNGWCENMAWISSDVLAIASDEPKAIGSNQIILLYDCNYNKNNVDPFSFKIARPQETPHEKGKGVYVICSIPQSNNMKTQWMTGGNDHKICMWSYEKLICKSTQFCTKTVHSLHSSGILSLHYDPVHEIVYSGGQDSKLIGFSIERNANLLPSGRQSAPVFLELILVGS